MAAFFFLILLWHNDIFRKGTYLAETTTFVKTRAKGGGFHQICSLLEIPLQIFHGNTLKQISFSGFIPGLVGLLLTIVILFQTARSSRILLKRSLISKGRMRKKKVRRPPQLPNW